MHRFALRTRGSSVVCAWFFLGAVGCGYSSEEWDQQLRESSLARRRLETERRSLSACEARYTSAREDADALRQSLSERGLSDDGSGASLDEQKQALEEYRLRTKQLDELRVGFAALRSRLQIKQQEGLKATVRDRRIVVEIPADVVFGGGTDGISKQGRESLLFVAEILRSGSEWTGRRLHVAVHTDGSRTKLGNAKDPWLLSILRAKSVVSLLTRPVELGGGGLDASGLSVQGYVDAEGASEEGRPVRNRVEVVIEPRETEMLNLGALVE